MSPLPLERAAGRTDAARANTAARSRIERGSFAKSSAGSGRLPRLVDRHAIERLRRRSLHKGRGRRRRPLPVHAASPVGRGAPTPTDPSSPDLAEPLALIGMLRDLGVSLVNVSLGNPYASPHLLRPFEYPPPDGYETPEHPLIGVDRHFRLTAAVQAAYPELAVVGSGYSWLQAYAFQAGAANVAAGPHHVRGNRPGALTQPDFGRRLRHGEPLDRKRLCRTFSYCTALMRSKHNEMGQFATGCPPFDKEVYGPIWEEAEKNGDQGSVKMVRCRVGEPRPGYTILREPTCSRLNRATISYFSAMIRIVSGRSWIRCR